MRKIAFIPGLAVIGLGLLAGMFWPAHAAAQVETAVEISSPAMNDVLTGIVRVTGTAVDPAFRFYHLEYAIDPVTSGSVWGQAQPPVSQQVRNAVLGSWDTRLVADGRYVLRLRIERTDGTSVEDAIRVTVSNATPTSPPVPTMTLLPGTATPGPSPTPLIQQPPTRTPRPTLTPGGPTATPDLTGVSPFDRAAIGQAARLGVRITLGAFALMGVYGLLRAAARGQLRRGWRRFRSEVLNPLLDTLRRSRR